ncbi:restriction endonuclease subunit M [Paraburkholderia tropica]|uniref:restriction endonuclease subunit M n=1 Tax=Paraburkholderia tropica TaxID=92647 RepID=UPI002ABDB5BA|nr:N-6 DNA methylase [Paraburkholderia tropica]
MYKEQKKAIIQYIREKDPKNEVIKSINPNENWNGGVIEYNGDIVHLHREISSLGDEEYVRAYLVVKLVKELGYVAQGKIVELEKSYSIGRPSKKSARVDLLVRYPQQWPDTEKAGNLFLFVECKSPTHFDTDKDFLKGQLFDLSKQEEPKPDFGVYYTVEFNKSEIIDRNIIVKFGEYPSWDAWDAAGQPAYSLIPEYFGTPKSIEYANIEKSSGELRPLRTDVTRAEFDRLRKEFHDVIWGGGGTNNNDVFVILIRLFLCRIFDELEATPSQKYRFQRASYTNGVMESPEDVVSNMTALFKEAAKTYLGYSESEIKETTPFEAKKISPAKVAFVVEQLQDKSLTRNTHRGDGDLLGDFFEGIVSQDFTQTKGQFFTHVNLVKFCIELSQFKDAVENTFLNERDPQGRPRIPKVIDPSCGSGTFLNEAMKAGTLALTPLREAGALPKRLKEYASMWFSENSQNGWAREFIYGIEPNADLGLAAKVNMILHGDGSTNIFVKSGLESFFEYALHDRSHGLAVTKHKQENFPYAKICNEEFDFIFTNPPFSITLSDDEKKKLNKNFYLGGESASENLFIERWYQLLRQSGHFVAVVPETVLDSSSSLDIRLFLFKYFKIKAAISLPYVAFKPFTSTKTCILMAEKKADSDVEAWDKAWHSYESEHKKLTKGFKSKDEKQQLLCAKRLLCVKDLTKEDMLEKWAADLEQLTKDGSAWIFKQVVTSSSIGDYEIFFAEPQHVGYKRRKGLPDLEQPNDLNQVLDCFIAKRTENLRYGFWGSLSELAVRPSLRMDPKYVHLWTKRGAIVFQSSKQNAYLAELLNPYKPDKISKGALESPRKLVDLANVESRMSIVSGLEEVDEIGSDKIDFGSAEIAISKLEPYLGKVLIVDNEEGWIGSPEWLTYTLSDKIQHIDYLRFLLLTPEMLEVYRCLQSGKRHARMSESDLLALKVPDLAEKTQSEIASQCRLKMSDIQKKRAEIDGLRKAIDVAIYSATPKTKQHK